MTTKPQSNVELKVAIIRTRKTQRRISAITRIPETRLSGIVRGLIPPTNIEKERLARAVRVPVEDLFSADTTQDQVAP